jgi:hypothetical protein
MFANTGECMAQCMNIQVLFMENQIARIAFGVNYCF